MERILKAKPIGIFLAILLPSFLIVFGISGSFFLNPILAKTIAILSMIIAPAMLYIWYLAIARRLILEIPEKIRVNYKSTGFYWGLILMLMGYGLIGYNISNFYSSFFHFDMMRSPEPQIEEFFVSFILFYVLTIISSLLTMFGNVLMILHCSRIIKTAQTGKIAHFKTSQFEFWMMMLNIIGIWIIQPRINKIMNGEYKSQWDDTPKELSSSNEILD